MSSTVSSSYNLRLMREKEETQKIIGDLGNFTTRSGQLVKLRYLEKRDAPLLVDLFNHLSVESRRMRFQCYTEKLPDKRVWQEAARLANLDPQCHLAIMATITEADGRECAVGVTRLARAYPHDKEVEVAIVVRDDFQRNGLGKYLLRKLAERAKALGITHFTGWVLAENVRLMKLIENLEVPVESEMRYGQRKIRVPI
ncbi:MAG TPA: GNAT family N-acetyltransferase [Anaerolineae bacterium]|nr:GNAT family N-acetyltransferase [Anaerolineae bacterium]HMR63015.1 GNAT family N-acetyltransferase [Anaerolineae bacterium]